MNGWLWLALAIAATAAGQLLFKRASVKRSRTLTLAAIVAFCIAPAAAYLALHSLSLATVYISTAISQFIVVVTSITIFGERYDARQWTGLAMIIVGVVIFNLKLPS